jgi:hypothetical protein
MPKPPPKPATGDIGRIELGGVRYFVRFAATQR